MRRIVVGRWWMVRLLAGLTIMAALAFAVPLGAAAATQPDTATFSVAATGTAELHYQWQLSLDGGASWDDISGANAATYTTPATSADWMFGW